MQRCLLLLFVLAFFSQPFCRAAAYTFDYSERCERASKAFLSLRLEEGASLIQQELKQNPANLMAVFIADYQDVLPLVFNGDKRMLESQKGNLDIRLNSIENGSHQSPWYRTLKAGLYLHWALVHLRVGDNYKAAIQFRKAYLLAKENQKLYPQFIHTNYFLGVGETVVGTVPDEYKWIASLFGMRGNVNNGLGKLTSFINHVPTDDFFRTEALIFHCYLKFYLQSRQEEVWKFVCGSQFNTQNNALFAFVKSNIAINYRKADVAIQTLQSVQSMPAFSQFPSFDYELGSAYLLKLDERAAPYLLRYIQKDKGKMFVKDAYMQLAMNSYMQGNLPKALAYRQAIKRNGSLATDADKQAQRFAEHTEWVAIPVAKARYMIDGGYYTQALEILKDCSIASLAKASDKLEYYFRTARAYDELNNDEKAIEYYRITVQQGRNRKEHFAARAALQMGFMYERAGRKQDAAQQYQDCLSMKNHDFQANIDQQAKAGLNRLNL